MNKLIVILGPTSSGKSGLAIKLARKFRGEIISADSRQVYKGMDIGTGKIPKDKIKKSRISDYEFKAHKTNTKFVIRNSEYYSGGIKHYLLDVASPKKQFTVTDFQRLLKRAVAQIRSKDKTPFLVGGTAFYIYAAIDDWTIPEVKPNLKLRKMLEKKSTPELFAMLKKLDPKRAKTIDRHNPHRLIRALEIVKTTGKPVPVILSEAKDLKKNSSFANRRIQNDKILILGIKKSPNELRKLINRRVDQRLKQGMVAEVKKLHRQGVSFKKLEEFGLEYRHIALYLQNQLPHAEMVQKLKSAIWRFSRRQMTWFKRDQRIHWLTNQKQAEKLIWWFLKNDN